MRFSLLLSASLTVYLGSGIAAAAGLLQARSCRPIQCGKAIVDKLKGLGKSTAECTAVGDGNIAQLGPCVSSVASELDFSTLDGCSSCGNCTGSQFTIAKNYLCGVNGDGTPFGVGPSRCAQLQSSNPAAEDNDEDSGSYVYHCNNHHVFDVTAGLCFFDCSNCNECSTCQGDPDNLANQPPFKGEDPNVYNQIATSVIIEQSEYVNPPSRRDLEDLQARQLPDNLPNVDEPDDTVFSNAARFRASNYARTCWNQPRLYFAGDEIFGSTGPIDRLRMCLPAPANVLGTGVRQAWQCDHVLELWMIDAFLNANTNYVLLRQRLNPAAPTNCANTRIKKILNTPLNLWGVEAEANQLKKILLQLDANTPYTNWGIWPDHIVVLLYKYLTDVDVGHSYRVTMDAVAGALQSENGGQDQTVANNFRNFVSLRLRGALAKLWTEYDARRARLHRPRVAARQTGAAPAVTSVAIPSSPAAGANANWLPLGFDHPDSNPADFDTLINA